ncbi:MAG: single-stranded-DNA-specific exonuclease RecJ [Flavobacteriales bacterium]
MMQKSWISKQSPEEELVKSLSNELTISPVLTRLLMQRGIDTFNDAASFFRPNLSQLHNPLLMRDMERAIGRLQSALEEGQKILVYGDYDVDGTTAVTVVYSFLKKLGANTEFYIPDRYEEGYGFSMKCVEWAAEVNFDLIITLDCGIKDAEKIARANELGMDVIVCDHHTPGELPPAYAVLNPKRSDCEYPDKGLSGCGVGFKFLQGWCQKFDPEKEEELLTYLDLVTIAIGADIVPLMGENRVLATFGLQRIAEHKRPGIKAMLQEAKFQKNEMTITDVVFILAPRINAAGRIFTGKQAVELLSAENDEEARKVSALVEANNNERRKIDKLITQEALQCVHQDPFYMDSFSTVVKSEGWHKGVVGIVASRLVEEFYKPSIVLTETEGKLSGSARSIPGIDLYEVLGKCDDLLEQFGGHAMAAGLSMAPKHFDEFRVRFDAIIKEQLSNERPKPYIEYDTEIKLCEITDRFFKHLSMFAPFGPENMKPVFLARNLQNAGNTRPVGENNAHLKLAVSEGEMRDKRMDGIGFDLGKWAEPICQNVPIDILFTIEENIWQGQRSLQLNVKDIRLSN